jgi:prepilin signal peptidase PulO-like enzyme (type II secretory pathway)
MRIATWSATALFAVLAVIVTIRDSVLFGTLFIVLAGLIYGGFYLIVAVKAAEHSLMLVKRTPSQLVVGDWVLGPVTVGKKVIIPTSSAGVSEREIATLRTAAAKKTVMVRQGVPFVPSFLLAFAVLVALRWWVFA